MAAVDLVVIALVAVLAFVAGWILRGRSARGGRGADATETADRVGPPTDPLPEAEAPARRREVEPLFTTPPPRRGAVSAAEPAGRAPASRPDPAAATLRLLDRAVTAYETAVDRWLDEGAQVSPAGRAAVGELDRAIQRVDVAASRIDERTEARFAALDALDGLRSAAKLLDGYRHGRTLDAATSRDLDALEAEVGRAREELASALRG
jgi:hypothetical protein